MARLLITSHTKGKGGIFLLDSGSGRLERIHDQPTHGLTRGPDGFYFVENYGNIFHLETETWKVTHRAATGYDGCHDLRYLRDHFYLVASQGNWVARFDPHLRPVDTFQVVEDANDVCHANCLIEAEGRLLLSIFTLAPGPREEKRLTPVWRHEGKILGLDWEAKRFEVLHEPLSQPHSLVWRDGALYCCESFTSRVTAVSLAGGKARTLRRLHGFVRGLAFAGGSAFVGISYLKNYLRPVERLLQRFRLKCGVIELDPRTWRPRREFPVPASQVYEILALEEE